jgi:hypothetical protein
LPMAGKKAGKKTRSFEQVFLCVPELWDCDNIFESLRLNIKFQKLLLLYLQNLISPK